MSEPQRGDAQLEHVPQPRRWAGVEQEAARPWRLGIDVEVEAVDGGLEHDSVVEEVGVAEAADAVGDQEVEQHLGVDDGKVVERVRLEGEGVLAGRGEEPGLEVLHEVHEPLRPHQWERRLRRLRGPERGGKEDVVLADGNR